MKKVLKKTLKTVLLHGCFPFVYKWYARKPIREKSVLFIEIRYAEITDNFRLLWDEFHKRNMNVVEAVFLGNSVYSYKKYMLNCFRMLKKLAQAEIVLVNDTSNVLAALPIRTETKVIQTWHGCGAFKRFGYDLPEGLKEKYYNNYTFTAVSSSEVIDVYASSMGQTRERILPIGVSRTDVFFSKEYIEKSNEEIRKKYKISSQKKIILYAPTFRGNAQKAFSPYLLKIDKLYQALQDEYVVLYKGHPIVKETIPIDDLYSQFFIDASEVGIEILMCSADICITDYSSLIFEYSLLERPIFFFAYDYKEYVTERGFYYDYQKFVPGPISYTEEELIQQIIEMNLEEQIQSVIAFKNQFMGACDGNSTQRIVDNILLEKGSCGII